MASQSATTKRKHRRTNDDRDFKSTSTSLDISDNPQPPAKSAVENANIDFRPAIVREIKMEQLDDSNEYDVSNRLNPSNDNMDDAEEDIGVYAAIDSDSLPVEMSISTPKPDEPSASSSKSSVENTNGMLNVEPICRLCAMFGRREIYVTPFGQREHVRVHLAQASELINVDESDTPMVVDTRSIYKCFPPKGERSTTPIALDRSERPAAVEQRLIVVRPRIPIAPSLPPVRNRYEGPMPPVVKDHEYDSSSTNTIGEVGGTARIVAGAPLFVPVKRSSSRLDDEGEESSSSDEVEQAIDHDYRPGGRGRSFMTPVLGNKSEERRQNKERAVQKLATIYNNPLLRTNFDLVPGGSAWPMFIAFGYRYRLSRANNRTGKVDLRCAIESCKGKAMIVPNGPYPYHLQTIDQHNHDPLSKSKLQSGTGRKKYVFKKKAKKDTE